MLGFMVNHWHRLSKPSVSAALGLLVQGWGRVTGLCRCLARAQTLGFRDQPPGPAWLPLENIFACHPLYGVIMECWFRETHHCPGRSCAVFLLCCYSVSKGEDLLTRKLWITEQVKRAFAGGIFSLLKFFFALRMLCKKEGKDER